MTGQVCLVLIQRRYVRVGVRWRLTSCYRSWCGYFLLMVCVLLHAEFYPSVGTHTLFSHHGPTHKPPCSSLAQMKKQHVFENLALGARQVISVQKKRHWSRFCPIGFSCLISLLLKGFTSLIKFFIFCSPQEPGSLSACPISLCFFIFIFI